MSGGEGIGGAIDAVRGRLVRARAAETGLRAAAWLVAAAIALCVLDNVVSLPAPARVATSVGFLLATAWLALGRVRPALAWRPADDEVALLIERSSPGLENRLINALQLGRRRLDGFGAAAALRIADEATDALAGVDARGAVPTRPVRRAGGLAAAAIALLALYALVFPEHLRNALARFAMPGAAIAPLTHTRLAVSPGNATLLSGDGLAVRAVASGEIPPRATLVVRAEGGVARYDMAFEGDAFAFSLEDLRAPLAYAVEAGDATSEEFQVEVVERPRLEDMAVEYRFPAYLGRAPERVQPSDGRIAAVEGTRAVLTATCSRALRDVEARLESGAPALATARGRDVRFEVDVTASDRYRLELRDTSGLPDHRRSSDAAAWHPIVCLPDRPPTVSIREPAREVAVRLDAEVAVAIEARDDWALDETSLSVAGAAGTPPRRLETWPGEGRREAILGAVVRVKDLGAKPGDALSLVARARDRKGQETTSTPLVLRVLSDRDAAAQQAQAIGAILARLRAVLEKQRAARDLAAKGKPAGPAQAEILALTRGILADWTDPELRRARAFPIVRGLAEREMPAATRESGKALASLQDAIVRGLEEALGDLRSLAEAAKAGKLDKALAASEALSPEAIAKELLRGLKVFEEEERKVLALTQDLRAVAPDDLTDAQKKELDELRATEAKWGKFFEEKNTDLSKVPPQDFSNGSLVKDMAGIKSELVKAADALGKKATEIAVPAEESGLELAKEITTNLERWLADAPDSAKWKMEEPVGAADVPMADLPAELEDIMGDLVDKEDKLAEEAQDVTSSWMDSLDKGVGWTVSDGPIANMSAKGITGNLQPNSNEIAGRSGEGRSGKSSGQFVGDAAVGKGGKPTPTRLTQDPYEAGRVKDAGKDASNGATGGGKEAGSNREGLRGEPPPETAQKMDRLVSDQADVRSAAEKVKVALERRGVRSEDLSKAIAAMRALEDELRGRRPGAYKGEVQAVTERLSAARKVAAQIVEASRDPSRALPQAMRTEIRDALDEPVPAEFEGAVRAYFRALSEGR